MRELHIFPRLAGHGVLICLDYKAGRLRLEWQRKYWQPCGCWSAKPYGCMTCLTGSYCVD